MQAVGVDFSVLIVSVVEKLTILSKESACDGNMQTIGDDSVGYRDRLQKIPSGEFRGFDISHASEGSGYIEVTRNS